MTIPVTILQMVTDRIAESDQILRDKDGLADWENIKQRAILRAKYRVYGTDKAETAIPVVVREYVAGLALLRLIPAVMDWFKDKRRLSEGQRGLSTTFYDHVETLMAERIRIQAELVADEALVGQLVSGYATVAVMDIDSLHVPKRGVPFTTELEDRKVSFDPFKKRLEDKPSE